NLLKTENMKKLLSVLCMLSLSITLMAQPAELLENEWHMHQLIKNGESFIPYGSNVGFIVDFYEGDPEEMFLEYYALHLYAIEIVFSSTEPTFEPLTDFGLADHYCTNDPCLKFGAQYDNFYLDVGGTYSYEITSNSNGSETLVVTAPNGDQAIYNTFLLSSESNALLDFGIAPNPVTELLSVSVASSIIESMVVYSASGQTVLRQKDTSTQLDVSDLTSGIYFVQINTEEGTTIKKFIKK
ncbi:MAG: T9SS type A sorting domain-containing protein, partial [Bacteroidota bacterium]